MSKNHTIAGQILHAIDYATAYGESKRSQMHATGDTGYKIYGYAYRQDLDKAAKALGSYIKAEYPDCRLVRDITPAMLQAYVVDRGKAEAWTSATYGKVVSQLHKLDKVCGHRYGSGWHSDQITVPDVRQDDKLRDHVATGDEYAALYADMRARKSEAWKALPLARYAGLRVKECANVRVICFSPTGGRYGCGTITLQGKADGAKGGRRRVVDILNLEGRQAIQEALQGRQPGEYVIQAKGHPLQPDSINMALTRAIRRCGLNVQEWQQNGVHAFRKAFAQDSYDVVRQAGGSKKDAIAYANCQLGHGRQRHDETKVYIQRLW